MLSCPHAELALPGLSGCAPGGRPCGALLPAGLTPATTPEALRPHSWQPLCRRSPSWGSLGTTQNTCFQVMISLKLPH